MSRNRVVLTGLVGLAGAVFLTGLCLALIVWQLIPALITRPLVVWAFFLFLLVFSVAEIPVMIFGLRRMAVSPNPKTKYVVLLGLTGYVFFGAVYAAPFILLTGRMDLGAALAGLSLVRFGSAIIYLPTR